MTARSIPRAFPLLAQQRNPAADAALLEILPDLDAELQPYALQLLIDRDHAPTLAELIGKIRELPRQLRDVLVDHAAALPDAVATAIQSDQLAQRIGAVEMIAQSGSVNLAYLLGAAVHGPCMSTRELASRALNTLTDSVVTRQQGSQGAPDAKLTTDIALLTIALTEAVEHWETHFLPGVLEAVMRLPEQMFDVVAQKLAGTRGRMAHMVNGLMEGKADERMVGFIVRALGVESLRATAGWVIAQAADVGLQKAILREWDVLHDTHLGQGAHWVRESPWLHAQVDDLAAAGMGQEKAAVSLLLCSGVSNELRAAQLRRLSNVSTAFAEQVAAQTSQASTVQGPGRPQPARAAAVHKTLEEKPRPPVASSQREAIAGGGTASAVAVSSSTRLEDFWSLAADPAADPQIWGPRFRPHVVQLAVGIRQYLTSGNRERRALGLRAVRAMRVASLFDEPLRKLVHDTDPKIRSEAVATLAELPGMVTERLLRSALHDPDDRVQANAVEALDRLDCADRAVFTQPKLQSKNNRVRANAIRSLLRLEVRGAAGALLAMLDDNSRSQRLSALWVVGHLRLHSLIESVRRLATSDPDPRVRDKALHLLSSFEQSVHSQGPVP